MEASETTATPAAAEEDLARRLGWTVLNAVQALFLCVWTAFWISIALVALVLTFRRSVPLALARRCWGPGILWAAGVKLVVSGGDEVDWTKPHVFVSNHTSMIDIPVAFVALRTNVRFVAKSALLFVPFLGWYMWATGMIFVDRGRSDRAIRSLQRAGERIRRGASILAYPEGTRSRDGRIQPFKKGAFVVALESQVTIVPIAIRGASAVFPRDGFRVRPGTIEVRIGAPIATAGLSLEDRNTLLERVRASMISLSTSMGGPGGA